MAGAVPSTDSHLEDLAERLLNCEICTSFFHEESCLPFALPCHHSFCSQCIGSVGSKGDFPCPLCRVKIPFNPQLPVSRQFPVERTLLTLLKWTRSVKEGRDLDELKTQAAVEMEACNRHKDEKKKYYCTTCRVPVCPSCALERHKDRDDHQIVSINSVYEEAKKELLAVSGQLERLETTARRSAEIVKENQQAMKASSKEVLEDIEDHFENLSQMISERKKFVLTRFQAQLESDRRALGEELLDFESMGASAQTTADFGKRVASFGQQTEVVTELYNIQRSATDLAKRCKRPPGLGIRYKMDSSSMLDFTQVLLHFGNIVQEKVERKEEKPPTKSPLGAALARVRKEELRFVCPEFDLDKKRCGPVCTLEGNCLTNQPPTSGEDQTPNSYAFPGTRGLVALTLAHVIYWQVKVTVNPDPGVRLSGVCCEVGMGVEADLASSSGFQWLCETCPSSVGVLVSADDNALQCSVVFKGDIWWEKKLCAWDNRSSTHRTLGFLVDGPGGKCYVIDVDDLASIGDVKLDLSSTMWPVVHVNPRAHVEGEVMVELQSGGNVRLERATVDLLHGLLTGMEVQKESQQPTSQCPLQ